MYMYGKAALMTTLFTTLLLLRMPVSRRINATESIATERAERKVWKPEQSEERHHEQRQRPIHTPTH